jgi:L-alanine-DL-glutamate epimerase-like enolase superfamily enzyme
MRARRSVLCTRLGSTYDLIAGLPLRIEGYELDGLELDFGGYFLRKTTLIRLHGDGREGVGEDVVYDASDHVAFQEAAGTLELAGSWTLDSFSSHLEELDLFPSKPERDVSRNYRRWAFESAALDLALRQSGRSLAQQLGRKPRPVTYVVSMRLAPPGNKDPETTARVMGVLERYPGTRFKLDPTNTWSDALIAELAGTGSVDSLDLKGQYKGTPVDVQTDPELYRHVAEAFPDAWLEDPDLNDGTRPVLEPYRDRITWDAVIHSVDDILALPFEPRMVNIKPSRFGPLRSLFASYDFCAERGIGAYGGGQTELGVGRDHIQYLAALFHPDTPNDVAPREFNFPQIPDGLPESPLELPVAESGFRFSVPLEQH